MSTNQQASNLPTVRQMRAMSEAELDRAIAEIADDLCNRDSSQQADQLCRLLLIIEDFNDHNGEEPLWQLHPIEHTLLYAFNYTPQCIELRERYLASLRGGEGA